MQGLFVKLSKNANSNRLGSVIFLIRWTLAASWLFRLSVALVVCSLSALAQDGTNLFSKPLTLADALEIALKRNTSILQAHADIRANEGVVIQTRSIALPRVSATGGYTAQDEGLIENIPMPSAGIAQPSQNWQSGIRVQQSIYEGGRLTSALRAAKLTREASQLNYETTVSDTLLAVRIAYLDTLLGSQQIVVQEASVKLLTRELDDVRRRFNAGTVPQFNVLRAEVELANAQPKLIRARNACRIAKNNLVNLLGLDLPRDLLENIPLELSDHLDAQPFGIDLTMAVAKALDQRTELAALRKLYALRREDIVNVRGGYKPSAQVFAGWQWRSPNFSSDLTRDFNGWQAGAQLSWNIFDGQLTRGKVFEAEARFTRARLDIEDTTRRIELQVRTAYSDLIQEKEVLESQKKVQEQAEEALRLAEARMDAGSGTQLDVLGAQTSLTEARTTQIQGLHDYEVAVARLNRAMGK